MKGSPIWNKIGRAWKALVCKIKYKHPSLAEEHLGWELWWTINFEGDKYKFSKKKVVELYNKYLKKMGSIFQKRVKRNHDNGRGKKNVFP